LKKIPRIHRRTKVKKPSISSDSSDEDSDANINLKTVASLQTIVEDEYDATYHTDEEYYFPEVVKRRRKECRALEKTLEYGPYDSDVE
jgi:hypothetical protein